MGWFVLLDAVLTLVMYAYLSMGEAGDLYRIRNFNISQGIVVVGAFSLALWGVIWLLCMAFAESLIQGFLCLFVPFYSLFFALSRWNERRGAFGLTLAPLAMLLISLIFSAAAVGVKKVNQGLYGPLQATNESAPDAPPVPAAVASDPKPSGNWFGGGGENAAKANAASVRRAEDAIRANIVAIRQVTSASSKIHDIASARANLGNVSFSARMAEVVDNRANFVKVGKNEMVALKHSVGAEMRSALSEFKQEILRISALLEVPAHIRDNAIAQIDKAIDKWTIKPGEETAPTLVEESTPFDSIAPNSSVSIGPGRQEKRLDNLRANYHNLRQEYGDRVVSVVISGMPGHGDPARGVTNRDVTAAVTQRLKELAPEAVRTPWFAANDKMSIVMAPVNDPQGLVSRIDFGTVTLNGDRIDVQLDPRYVATVPRLPAESKPVPQIAAQEPQTRPPDPEVPVGADTITKSLIELKSVRTPQEEAGPQPAPASHSRRACRSGHSGGGPPARRRRSVPGQRCDQGSGRLAVARGAPGPDRADPGQSPFRP